MTEETKKVVKELRELKMYGLRLEKDDTINMSSKFYRLLESVETLSNYYGIMERIEDLKVNGIIEK